MSTIGDELKHLVEFLEQGFITREQFDRRRNILLARGAPADSNAPHRLGDYQVIGILGQGGMGVVYRAQHRLDRSDGFSQSDVAIKVLYPQYACRPDIVERFKREAGLGMKLEHPGIVKVRGFLETEERVALVMERVDGHPLSEVIGTLTGPIPWLRSRYLFSQLLDAVSYAHGQGVIHRDLKPDNMMLTPDGRLKILDFGIAKDLKVDRTQTGMGLGTVDYMAPEQYQDAKGVDPRADIYALGMTLYEMLAGRLPWGSDTSEFEVLKRKEMGTFAPPTEFYPDIPPHVVSVVMRMLRPVPRDRYMSCPEILEVLRDGEVYSASDSDVPVPARPAATASSPSSLREQFREVPVARVLLTLLAMVVLFLAFGAVGWMLAE